MSNLKHIPAVDDGHHVFRIRNRRYRHAIEMTKWLIERLGPGVNSLTHPLNVYRDTMAASSWYYSGGEFGIRDPDVAFEFKVRWG